MSKILVPKTDYLVEINEVVRAISILGNPNWEITASFEAKENQATLDENGDLFEPIYKLNLRAIPKFDLELETSSQAKDLKKNSLKFKHYLNLSKKISETSLACLDTKECLNDVSNTI